MMKSIVSDSEKKRKNKFSPPEDALLKTLINDLHCSDWKAITSHFPGREPRQCRERWNNYVNPILSREQWSLDEDGLLENKYTELGPKWQAIASFFPGRGKNYIKNRWMRKQKHLAKAAQKMDAALQGNTSTEAKLPAEAETFDLENDWLLDKNLPGDDWFDLP
jgi:hypothetical protein